jgi:hypothetical protein
MWNKEELPDQWKESTIVPIYKKDDKNDCSNYHGISLLSSPYIILSNIFHPVLCTYLDEITGEHQCEFGVTDQLLHLSDTAEKMEVHGDSTSAIYGLQESL